MTKKKEKSDLKSQLARALADYDNLKKRVEKEKEQFAKIANLTLVVRLLPVLDMIEGAQKHLKDPGLAMGIKEFKEALRAEGVVEIDTKSGMDFDEDLHEAVETVASKKDGEIKEVLLSGWQFVDGPVIRHVKVRVTRSAASGKVKGSKNGK